MKIWKPKLATLQQLGTTALPGLPFKPKGPILFPWQENSSKVSTNAGMSGKHRVTAVGVASLVPIPDGNRKLHRAHNPRVPHGSTFTGLSN